MDVIRSRAFEFIETVQELSDTASVLDAMGRMLGQYGPDQFCCAYVAPLSTEAPREAVLAHRLPPGFLDMYSTEQFVWDDPALRHCKTTLRPFRWFGEAPFDPVREPRAVELVQRARDFGLLDGVMVPIASPSNRIGHVFFGGREIDLPERDLPALHLMALYAFDRALALRGQPEAQTLALSLRECEVLTLAAIGRSTDEIADALTITPRTVKAHVKSCCKKLGATTRTQAVMIAMRDRIISP
ncbi:helix-turn-helix transcriptional regulator [Bradyrhizobium zhanjiangense]|uniref:LuxR family transcriptional regulator n=1 Tax=Bradyrhizobium zhanjiangense TaxID=1325107 RepID=A0ABY0D8T7_9BRAD|nr:LuxR family transcriptional regulator [Bradyrhizobium zhanjiangense]RXG85746.1 LuxR family transcriptional regulator [Bradyrhizobium zhanjiangense]